MWVLEGNEKDPGKKHYLHCNEKLQISRKKGHILLTGDQSISRDHATIEVRHPKKELGNLNRIPEVILCDSGSKFGTFVNEGIVSNSKVQERIPITLKIGDKVRFGVFQNTWSLNYEKMIVATTLLSEKERITLLNLLLWFGAHFTKDWVKECTHLVSTELKLTPKAVCALASALPIVKIEYLEKLKEAILAKTSLPKVTDHMPILKEIGINRDQISLAPNPTRKSLLKDRIVVFSKNSTQNRFFPLVKLMGGAPTNVTEEIVNEITKENYIFIKPPRDHSSDLAGKAIQRLKAAKLSVIAEADIGLAVVYANTLKYCNPKFNHSSLLRPSSSSTNSTQATLQNLKVYATETCDLDEGFTKSPLQNPTNKKTIPESLRSSGVCSTLKPSQNNNKSKQEQIQNSAQGQNCLKTNENEDITYITDCKLIAKHNTPMIDLTLSPTKLSKKPDQPLKPVIEKNKPASNGIKKPIPLSKSNSNKDEILESKDMFNEYTETELLDTDMAEASMEVEKLQSNKENDFNASKKRSRNIEDDEICIATPSKQFRQNKEPTPTPLNDSIQFPVVVENIEDLTPGKFLPRQTSTQMDEDLFGHKPKSNNISNQKQEKFGIRNGTETRTSSNDFHKKSESENTTAAQPNKAVENKNSLAQNSNKSDTKSGHKSNQNELMDDIDFDMFDEMDMFPSHNKQNAVSDSGVQGRNKDIVAYIKDEPVSSSLTNQSEVLFNLNRTKNNSTIYDISSAPNGWLNSSILPAPANPNQNTSMSNCKIEPAPTPLPSSSSKRPRESNLDDMPAIKKEKTSQSSVKDLFNLPMANSRASRRSKRESTQNIQQPSTSATSNSCKGSETVKKIPETPNTSITLQVEPKQEVLTNDHIPLSTAKSRLNETSVDFINKKMKEEDNSRTEQMEETFMQVKFASLVIKATPITNQATLNTSNSPVVNYKRFKKATIVQGPIRIIGGNDLVKYNSIEEESHLNDFFASHPQAAAELEDERLREIQRKKRDEAFDAPLMVASKRSSKRK